MRFRQPHDICVVQTNRQADTQRQADIQIGR